ncbi:snurportin-1 [Melitaea cinxia]|uniref:snurportin-1 n=1 Tax=Melitaea cinxia TaxID=113334 RepID=UPI001E271BAA|nr:snurportin-1 [Melitaea cinxia]
MEENLEILEKALLKLEASEAEGEKSSNYEDLYKNRGKFKNQEERRKQLLEIQKSNRHNKIDRHRGILDLVSEKESNIFEASRKVSYRPNIYVAGFQKTCLSYNNVLMLSEWMVEKPSDFNKNWYVVPCPVGQRLLVIANYGTTKFYTKHGNFKFECSTGLPGGNPYNYFGKNCCILDCFYNENTKTVYLLDILAWNKQLMTDGETEFRQYWMKSQLEDFPDTKTINKKNKVIITILPMMPCTNDYLSYLLSKYPQFENNTPPLDGLLFYHKRAHYVAGETPLVGWLYPYMIPEVLGEDIYVHPGYMEEMPDGYVNQMDFIEKFAIKLSQKLKGRAIKNENETGTNDSEKMETEEKVEEKIVQEQLEKEKVVTE